MHKIHPPTKRELLQHHQRATIKDVARAAGVSIGTVSRALTGSAKVLPQTSSLVLEAVKRLGYVPDSAAQSLRSRQTRAVGCAVPLASHPVFVGFVSGAEQTLRGAGYAMVLGNTTDQAPREAELMRFFEQRKVDGIITTLSREDDLDAVGRLRAMRAPVVLLERRIEDGFDAVLTDQGGGCELAATHLLDCGHRRITLVTSTLANWPSRERYSGFLRAYAARQLDPGGAEVFTMHSSLDFGISQAISLLQKPERPTAVIVGVQELVGLLRAARACGMTIPDGLSIIAIGGSDVAELT